jgi:hypothetical protein
MRRLREEGGDEKVFEKRENLDYAKMSYMVGLNLLREKRKLLKRMDRLVVGWLCVRFGIS